MLSPHPGSESNSAISRVDETDQLGHLKDMNTLEHENGRLLVAVTEHEYRKASEILESLGKDRFRFICVPAEEKALAASLSDSGARHVILGVDRYGADLYSSLEEGAVLARFGVGYDGIDLEKATDRGLLCTNTPGVISTSVAELAVTFILSAARGLCRLNSKVKTGEWSAHTGSELYGKTLAIIGCGAIGTRLAQTAAFGLRMRVVGCDTRSLDAGKMRKDHGFEFITSDFKEAVSDAAMVSIHIPACSETRRFINRERLELMPENSWLINTARGSVVDESALYDALASGIIAGAALDVFENEPYKPVDSKKDLRTLPNTIMTPHCASTTAAVCRKISERVVKNLVHAENSEYAEMDLLNREILSRIPAGKQSGIGA